MPISVQCTCGRRLSAPDDAAGKRIKCPACGAVSELPYDSAALAETGVYEPPTDEGPPTEEEAPAQSMALAAAMELSASAAGAEATCPACRAAVAIDAAVCVQCGHKFAGFRGGTRRAARKPRDKAPAAVASRPTISMHDIFVAPLTGTTIRAAMSVALIALILGGAMIGLMMVAATFSAHSLMLARIIAAGALVVALLFYAWFNSRLLGIIEQASEDQWHGSTRSMWMDVLLVVVVSFFAHAPMILVTLSIAFGGSADGAVQGDGGALILLTLIWSLLYYPMGLAVAASDRTINPWIVIKRIVQTLPAYILVLIYIGAAGNVVYWLGGAVGVSAMGLDLGQGGLVGLLASGALLLLIGFYYAISCAVMMGLLLRRARRTRGVGFAELGPSVLWVGGALSLSIALVVMMPGTSDWSSLTRDIDPDQIKITAGGDDSGDDLALSHLIPGRDRSASGGIGRKPPRLDADDWPPPSRAANGEALPYPITARDQRGLNVREGVVAYADGRYRGLKNPTALDDPLVSTIRCGVGQIIVAAGLHPAQASVFIQAMRHQWHGNWVPRLIDADGKTRYRPVGCAIVNEDTASFLLIVRKPALSRDHIPLDDKVSDRDLVYLYYELPGVVKTSRMEMQDHRVPFPLDERTPGYQPIDRTPVVNVEAVPDPEPQPDPEPRVDLTQQIDRPRAADRLIALPTVELPAPALAIDRGAIDVRRGGHVREGRGMARAVNDPSGNEQRTVARYMGMPESRAVRVALSESDSQAIFEDWSGEGVMRVPLLVDTTDHQYQPQAMVCMGRKLSRMYIQYNTEHVIRRWPQPRPDLSQPRLYLYYEIDGDRPITMCRWGDQQRDLTFVHEPRADGLDTPYQPTFSDGKQIPIPFVDAPHADLEYGRRSMLLRADDRFATPGVGESTTPQVVSRIDEPSNDRFALVRFPNVTGESLKAAVAARQGELKLPVLYTKALEEVRPVGCLIGRAGGPSVRFVLNPQQPLNCLTEVVDDDVADDDEVYFYFMQPMGTTYIAYQIGDLVVHANYRR